MLLKHRNCGESLQFDHRPHPFFKMLLQERIHSQRRDATWIYSHRLKKKEAEEILSEFEAAEIIGTELVYFCVLLILLRASVSTFFFFSSLYSATSFVVLDVLRCCCCLKRDGLLHERFEVVTRWGRTEGNQLTIYERSVSTSFSWNFDFFLSVLN